MKFIFSLFLVAVFFVSGCSSNTKKETKPSNFPKDINDKVLKFSSSLFRQNPQIVLRSLNVRESKNVPNAVGWKVFIIDVALEFRGKKIELSDMVFSDGKVITQRLFDLDTQKDFKSSVMPTMTNAQYNKEHFVVGNPNGKNKVVIFSDPLCPFCKAHFPGMLNFIKNNTKDTALYYYHYPLESLHPSSSTIVKAILVAQKRGVKDILIKVYKANFEEEGLSPQEVLNNFNQALNTNITLDDIKNPEILAQIQNDVKIAKQLMISGTPTVFVNGIRDESREKYKDLK